ncbi:uncharacterized protein LOC135339577 [Halichondria panicea]|uniref:uncharacterized protein LOC135339577 n=1 Tax=Halichondria panicea TaxID=6063 RepID=UPI00312B7C79
MRDFPLQMYFHGKVIKFMYTASNAAMAYLGRPEESFRSSLNTTYPKRNDIMSWRRKKRSSPAVNCDYDNQSSPCKRFAPEELVTAYLRDLNLSSPPPTPSRPLLPPPHHHTPHSSHPHIITAPHTLTSSHSLLVASLTECPGLVGTNGYSIENQVPSDAWHNLGQPIATWETTGVDNETTTRGSSPLLLIDDTSCRGSQGRGEEASPPVYPIQATTSTNRQWTIPHNPSLFSSTSVHHLLPDCNEQMSNDQYTDDNGHFLQGDSPPSHKTSPLTPPEGSPVQHTLPWRQVTIEEASSDSSDGTSDGPERPLSLWIAPELIKCVEKGISNSLPQSLLEKYNKPVGMELVLWVDQSTLFSDTKEMEEVEMVDSAEPIWDNSDMDS